VGFAVGFKTFLKSHSKRRSSALIEETLMPPFRSEPDPASSSSPAGSPPAATGILLCRDLIFTTKVRNTAEELGYRVLVASNPTQARAMIESSRPGVVFVDLTAGELVEPGVLSGYIELSGPGTWFVAFGPHVEGGALAAAKAAGCQAVMARSKFAAELPALMRQYFSRPATPPQD
jgi:hypothetical protein